MKTILLVLTASQLLCIGAMAGSTNSSPSEDPLLAKYDLNGNGKIDVNERGPYIRELSRLRHEEAKALAVQQPVLSSQERPFYRPPQLTPELIQKYDANHDGKLDFAERQKLYQDAAEIARQEFRRFDINQDGKLDKEELKAMQQSRQREVQEGSAKTQASPFIKPQTNTPALSQGRTSP